MFCIATNNANLNFKVYIYFYPNANSFFHNLFLVKLLFFKVKIKMNNNMQS